MNEIFDQKCETGKDPTCQVSTTEAQLDAKINMGV